MKKTKLGSANKTQSPTMKKLLLSWGPTVALFLMLASYIPQLVLTYTTQNVEGQSLVFWILLTGGLFFIALQQYGMIKYNGAKEYMGFVFQALNTLLAFAMLVGVIIFS